jgi:hypothetical protein
MTADRVAVGWGFRAGLRRARAPRSLLGAALVLGLVALLAYAERRAGLFGATSRALSDRVFGTVLPIALLAGSTRILLPVRLDQSSAAAARLGASRRAVALGTIVASMIALALFAALAASTAAWFAHDPTAPPRLEDCATSGWIGALTACAYAGLFAFGSTFGARGGGRLVALVCDLALGGAVAAVPSLLVPSSHAQNLLGGPAPLSIAQSTSALGLAALAAGFTVLALYRCPP